VERRHAERSRQIWEEDISSLRKEKIIGKNWNRNITAILQGDADFCCTVEWTRHYAANRKVAGSIPDEVNFSIYIIFPVAPGPGVYSASNRNEYQKH
jgi:hypothetical protein